MLNLDSIAAFIAIANTGSFSEAARQLALSKSVVSDRLQQLERSLATKLVQRMTRRVSLTTEGAVFFERARRLVSDGAESR